MQDCKTDSIFADDLMVFCNREEHSMLRAREAVEQLSAAICLIANFETSSIFIVGSTDQMKDILLVTYV